MAGLLATAPAVHSGQRSYAVYLWHYPLLQAAMAVGLVGTASPPLAVIAGLLLASFAAAELSWRLVERRALAYVDRPGRSTAPPTDDRARAAPASRTITRHASLDRAPAR
jgi:peptidoglycan/LPS O-acetylase OafA/YrhL